MGCKNSTERPATQVIVSTKGGMTGKDFASAVKDRRTYYALDKNVKVSEDRIREIVEYAITWAPSSFNSQSQRVAILFGAQHDKFWEATREILRAITPADKFESTDQKMTGFKNGFATVLFFEDQPTINKMEADFPSFAAAFQPFSLQSNGMAQYIAWTALEAEGLGCNLQHYSPLVDETIQKEWGVPSTWKLLAQMVVGNPVAQPGEKTHLPIQDRVKFFSSESGENKQVVTGAKGLNTKDFASAVKDRRTVYTLDKNVKVSDARIREIVEYALTWAPSSFNSQSQRAIILVGDHHDKFWEGTREILRGITSPDKFPSTDQKMTGFKNGFATVLFFEDQPTIQKMEADFPAFAAAFQPFSFQSNGMAQYIAWTALEAEGLGCNLQHYSPLVDETIQKQWGVPSSWKLLAQMVVGNPIAQPGDKTFLPIHDRVKFFSSETKQAKHVSIIGKGINVKDFASAVKDRRTYYALDKHVKVSDARIREIVEYALTWAPSSFNSQSARAIILVGSHHDRFWESTREILRKIVPAEHFASTNDKMNGFKNGYATVLFFEDQTTIHKMEDDWPAFAQAFQPFSLQSNGMAQYIAWAGLETEGLGCNLQHYSPLVDETVQREWGAPTTWKLLAQMVVGNPIAEPGDKTFLPIQDRVKQHK